VFRWRSAVVRPSQLSFGVDMTADVKRRLQPFDVIMMVVDLYTSEEPEPIRHDS
jgi:hypothetical protein